MGELRKGCLSLVCFKGKGKQHSFVSGLYWHNLQNHSGKQVKQCHYMGGGGAEEQLGQDGWCLGEGGEEKRKLNFVIRILS